MKMFGAYLLFIPIVLSKSIEKASGLNKVMENDIYAYAIDINTSVSPTAFRCIRQSGYSTVFVQAYQPHDQGSVDLNVVQNVFSASNAGLGIEIFATPQKMSSKSAVTQFDELITYLRNNQITVSRVWLKVTSPINWDHSQKLNIEFIDQFIRRAKQYNVAVGIYTNWYDWQQTTADWQDWIRQHQLLLWYWNVLGHGESSETYPDFNDFRPYAGYKVPAVKQFGETTSVCGVIVNQNVYGKTKFQSSQSIQRDAQNTENKKGIVVGTLKLPVNGVE